MKANNVLSTVKEKFSENQCPWIGTTMSFTMPFAFCRDPKLFKVKVGDKIETSFVLEVSYGTTKQDKEIDMFAQEYDQALSVYMLVFFYCLLQTADNAKHRMEPQFRDFFV